ncbi:hypothetical protein D3C80_1515390 [compost metagenome]
MPGFGGLTGTVAAQLETSREAEAIDHPRTVDQHQAATVVDNGVVFVARAPADQGPPQLLAKVVQQVGGLLAALVLGIHGEHHLKAIFDVLRDRVLSLVLAGLVISSDHIGRGIFQQR